MKKLISILAAGNNIYLIKIIRYGKEEDWCMLNGELYRGIGDFKGRSPVKNPFTRYWFNKQINKWRNG